MWIASGLVLATLLQEPSSAAVTGLPMIVVLQENLLILMAYLLLRRWGQWTGWSSELAEPVKEDSDGSDLGFNFL